MNERVYSKGLERLRSPERLQRLEVSRVAELVIQDEDILSVLDVGTGSAVFAEEFSTRKIKVSGIDINPEAIEAASELLPGTDFKVAAAEKIPYGDGSFDTVFMGLVFHEVDDYSMVLNEAFRVAVKNVALLEWNYVTEEFGPPLEHRLKPEFISGLAKEAGFKNIEILPLKFLSLYKLHK